jgi:hypothetical protein
MRWGLGPVFRYECVAEARRWQFYAARVVAVGALLAGMMSVSMLMVNVAVWAGSVERLFVHGMWATIWYHLNMVWFVIAGSFTIGAAWLLFARIRRYRISVADLRARPKPG